MKSDLIDKTAVEVVSLLRKGEVLSHELLDALERRIGEVDGAVGAPCLLSALIALESTLTGSQPYPWNSAAFCVDSLSRSRI